MVNLAHDYVQHLGKDLAGTREEYDGACIDFAGEMLDWLGRGRLAYFECPRNPPRWRYHAAVQVEGMIHDLWQPSALALNDFMKLIGADEVDYPAEEADYEGD